MIHINKTDLVESKQKQIMKIFKITFQEIEGTTDDLPKFFHFIQKTDLNEAKTLANQLASTWHVKVLGVEEVVEFETSNPHFNNMTEEEIFNSL